MEWIYHNDKDPDGSIEHIIAWNEVYGPYILHYNPPDKWMTDEYNEVEFTHWMEVLCPIKNNQEA